MLGLKPGQTDSFTADTGLTGHLPELDSMAVAGLLTEIEDRLGIMTTRTRSTASCSKLRQSSLCEKKRLIACHISIMIGTTAASSRSPPIAVARASPADCPALFDEANKLRRRHTVEVIRRLDAAGIDCLLPDLPGCGESLSPLAEQTLPVARRHGGSRGALRCHAGFGDPRRRNARPTAVAGRWPRSRVPACCARCLRAAFCPRAKPGARKAAMRCSPKP